MIVYVLLHETYADTADENNSYIEGVYATEAAAEAARRKAREAAIREGRQVWDDPNRQGSDLWRTDEWRVEGHQVIGASPSVAEDAGEEPGDSDPGVSDAVVTAPSAAPCRHGDAGAAERRLEVAAIDRWTDLWGNEWARNDRVEMTPFGQGRIALFVSSGDSYVDFDNPVIGFSRVRMVDLRLVRRRTTDEIPCDVAAAAR